jgi:hypothetical protein
MAWDKCDECKGSGKIMTESIHIGRPRYSKAIGGLEYEVYGMGNWAETICSCVGEEDYLQDEYDR